MKWNTNPKSKYKTTQVILKDLQKKTLKNGQNLVLIVTEDSVFTGFESVWNNQDINVEDLNKGDTLEITYKKNLYHNNWYNNFYKVKFLKHAVQYSKIINEIMNKPEPVPETLIDEVVNSIEPELPASPEVKTEDKQPELSDEEAEKLIAGLNI